MHQPWWVVKTLSGDAEPEPMQDGDEWVVVDFEASKENAELRADAERYRWVLPIVSGEDDPDVNKRMGLLGNALASGLTGTAAIDAARKEKL
jgi:hypothetical protein